MKRLLTAKAQRAQRKDISHGFLQIKNRLKEQEIRIKAVSHKATKNTKKKQRQEKEIKDIGYLLLVTLFVVSAGGFVREVTFP